MPVMPNTDNAVDRVATPHKL